MSYLPLVESFFVGRGRRFYEKCGATAFGVCQGDFGEKYLALSVAKTIIGIALK